MHQHFLPSLLRLTSRVVLLVTLLWVMVMPSRAFAQSTADAGSPRIFLPIVAGGQATEQFVQAAASSDIIISQVYGGGGNSGATYTNDFIELFNRGTTAVVINGWSVQYASAVGSTWSKTDLSGTLQPGQYYLIQEGQGSGGTTALPTPNATGSIAMSASSGKVLLLNTNSLIAAGIGCPSDSTVVDTIGFGTANCFEGSGATPALTNTTAAIRLNSGCNESDDNVADFIVSAPTPRNTESPLASCVTPTNPSGVGAANPNPAIAGGTTLLTVAVTPGSNPTSTGLAVICDLAALGGAAPQSFFDDGSNGDVTAADNIFSYQATVAANTSSGAKNLPCTITDAEARSGSTTIALSVQAPVVVAALVINEVDYDQPSTDSAEFVEIRNNDLVSVDLSGYTLQLLNGNGGGAAQYQLFALPAVNLAPGDYFVLCSNAANVPNCDLDVTPDTDLIQNGAPDAVALRFGTTLVDAVSYEGNSAAPYTEGSGVGLLDDPAFAGAGLSRCPDGADSNQNDIDFSFHRITPGAANACLPAVVINELDYDQPNTDGAEFIELRNNDLLSVDLSSFSLELVNGNAGGAVIYQTIALNNGALAAGEYYVVCANTATVANCDQDVAPDTNLIQNGAPDAIGLRYNGTLIDAVSYEGETAAPYTEGSATGLLDDGVSATQGLARCPDGADTNQNNVDFGVHPITPGIVNDCAVDVAPTVVSTNPANGVTDASTSTNIVINFSENVSVSGNWFSITCTNSGAHSAVVSGGAQSYTLNPDIDFTDGETCSVTIAAANVSDQDGASNNLAADYLFSFTAINVCALTYTPIYAIQGSGAAASITGVVTTQGVVVGDYEGPAPTLRGFYIQDVNGDGNPSTSDGIFVFNGDNNNVSLGDLVRVTGTAAEFQDQTQLSSVTALANCGSGTVAPVDVTLPAPSATYLEQYEGMLVRFPQPLYVSEHFQLGRFGQVLLSANGRLHQPTNVVAPGAPALALQAQNDLNKIILDDDLQSQNPDPIVFGRNGNPLSASNTLRGGDTATGIVGLMTYTWAGNAASGNAYRLRPINALGGGLPNFQPANPRPASAPAVGGSLKVVGMNLLNLFNTFGTTACTNGVGGGATECRGADDAGEFARQWPKTVAAILALNPDVLGVNELENDGYGTTSALQFLVDQLNGATAPGTYAFLDVDAATGQVNAMGLDAIKVALIYKPAVVTPVGQTAALNTTAFINGGDSGPRNRASVAQAFQQNATGEVLIVNVNHLKSKGSACDAPDAGDGQGNCNTVRVNAVNQLLAWFATDPTGTGDPDILMIGDYNSYALEDPITTLIGAGFTNLVATFLGPDAYSYVFDGQWGYLDHALGSPSLAAQVAGIGDYHINADEPAVLDYNDDFKSAGQIASLYAPDPFRVSDHDPVVVGLTLDSAPPVVTVTGVNDGASYPLGSVPTAGCDTQDAQSGVATPATLTVTGGNGNGLGSFTATCSGAVDHAGNSANPVSVTYTVTPAGTAVGSCGDYTVYQDGATYSAPGWSGAIRVGTNGNNTILGTSGPDLILGLGGNDLLTGNGGDDLLCGGNGVDLLLGLNGNDLLDGGDGHDVLNGGGGDYDRLIGGAGNDALLDGDGLALAQGGAGNDLFTLALRNGWRDHNGDASFTGLTAGYGNDTVGLLILGSTPFLLDITGDERDDPPSPQEGNNDKLTLIGAVDPASTVIKFEHRLIISADAEQTIPDADAGAEYLTEPVGEEGGETGAINQIFLPLVEQ